MENFVSDLLPSYNVWLCGRAEAWALYADRLEADIAAATAEAHLAYARELLEYADKKTDLRGDALFEHSYMGIRLGKGNKKCLVIMKGSILDWGFVRGIEELWVWKYSARFRPLIL
jgi:hypothetical protein